MHRSPVQIPTFPHNKIPPPTPGPSPIGSIQNDALKRFAGLMLVIKDSDRTLDDYFIEYDFWEPYSETKSYSKRSYHAAYKGIMREYKNYLCMFTDDNSELVAGDYYVVAKHVLSELELLEPYCTCFRCIFSVINPIKYLWCAHCTKCIKAGPGFADEKYITKARELKRLSGDNTGNTSKYTKYLQELRNGRWILIGEVTVASMAILWATVSAYI